MFVYLQLGSPQRLPKRLRFVVDVSGSMYRFNGLDGRLDRMMEAACLVMEAFDKFDDKIKVFFFIKHIYIYIIFHEFAPNNNNDNNIRIFNQGRPVS